MSLLSCALRGRDRSKFLDDAVHLGLGDSEDGRYLTDGFALIFELCYVIALNLPGLVGTVAEVLRFVSKFYELEVDEATVVGDLVDNDVVATVFLLAGTDFQLLDVTQPVILGGLADGHHAVKVVEQALGACQVVLRDGAGKGTLGRVRDNQQRPAVHTLELEEVHHKLAGIDALVG